MMESLEDKESEASLNYDIESFKSREAAVSLIVDIKSLQENESEARLECTMESIEGKASEERLTIMEDNSCALPEGEMNNDGRDELPGAYDTRPGGFLDRRDTSGKNFLINASTSTVDLEEFQSELRHPDNPSTSTAKPKEERETESTDSCSDGSTSKELLEASNPTIPSTVDGFSDESLEASNHSMTEEEQTLIVARLVRRSSTFREAERVELQHRLQDVAAESEREKESEAVCDTVELRRGQNISGFILGSPGAYNTRPGGFSERLIPQRSTTSRTLSAFLVESTEEYIPTEENVPTNNEVNNDDRYDLSEISAVLVMVEQDNNILAVTAEPVKNDRKSYILLFLILIVIFGLAVSLPLMFTHDVSPASNERPLRPTLETVLENGVVKCGVGAWVVRTTDENGNIFDKGPEVDLCRAIAAAVFGDSNRSEIIYVTFSERWEFLLDGSVDIVTLGSTHTMVRDVYMEVNQGGSGFGFTDPYFYSGIGVGGVPPFGKCADKLAAYDDICRDLRVCVSDKGIDFEVMTAFLPDINVRAVPFSEKNQRFIDGDCNAIAGPVAEVTQSSLESKGYFGPYETGINIFSKDPASMATRNDDPEWLDFANWVLRALKAAEEQKITMSTAQSFMKTTVFGEQFENMFSNAIGAVGNYWEFYDRNFGSDLPKELWSHLPREGLNEINKGTTGLIYPHPFGSIFLAAPGPGPREGSTLDIISKRGHLRCGVVSSEWKGLDEDYCLALASSMFPSRNVHFENLASMEDGFVALASGEIDVLAGGILNLQNDVLEPTTGEGFSFTQPYFYVLDEVVALVTTQKDPLWSDFVYWVVASTFYAEEINVQQDDVADMPQVNLFGPQYEDMFRNAIEAVGNYGDMYARNVESVFPRKGRNLLNTNPLGPQHFSFF